MEFFGDIVRSDSVPSRVATPAGVPRITVRPKSVELPPGPENASWISADASDETEDVPPVHGDLFGDISPTADEPSAETPPSSGPAPRVAREGRSPPAPQSASLLSRLATPVTDIPHEIYEAGAESLGAANTYLNPWSEDYRKGAEADRDKWIRPGSFLGTGKGLLAAIGVPFSPAIGTIRSLIGHPLSVIMPTATPEEQEKLRAAGVAESMIPGQTREENYQKIKRDVELAMMAVSPRGFTPRGAIPRAGPRPPERPPDTAAAQSDRITSEARESGPFDSGARRAEATTPRRGESEATPAEIRASPDGRFYSVAFEMRLKLSSYRKSRRTHVQEANEALLGSVESDPEFARAMRQQGIEIRRTPTGLAPRKSPDDWTWHHAEEPGVMQLIPRSQHDRGTIFQGVLHPHRRGGGGYSKWGK
jgi:hypothetical protein